MSTIAFAPSFCNNPFQQFSRSFLDDSSLAFTQVLPGSVFQKGVNVVFRERLYFPGNRSIKTGFRGGF
jgi:hypothetical protein